MPADGTADTADWWLSRPLVDAVVSGRDLFGGRKVYALGCKPTRGQALGRKPGGLGVTTVPSMSTKTSDVDLPRDDLVGLDLALDLAPRGMGSPMKRDGFALETAADSRDGFDLGYAADSRHFRRLASRSRSGRRTTTASQCEAV